MFPLLLHRHRFSAFVLACICYSGLYAQPAVLKASSFKHYVDSFNENDNELYKQYYPNDKAWNFLENNIPLFQCPDKQLESTYYFRWWTFRKHINKTPDGFVITEFLPAVNWAGKYNTINCAAGHHIYEGRWLHDPGIVKDYIDFWFKKGGSLRSYSTWLADAVYKYCEVKGNFSLAKSLLPQMISNFGEWEKTNRSNQGLFWSVDNRDGMEVSVSGNGLRPTLNSYMYADALAISKIASLSKDEQISYRFQKKADDLKQAVQQKLWDKEDQFFKVIPMKDKNQKDPLQDFKDYGRRNVRELLGYTPWYVNMPDSSYSSAWKQLLQKDGFYATFGLTTTEQRSPGFTVSYEGHECQWNGPSWPFATSITLTALSNLLHHQTQPYVSKKDYLFLLQTYSSAHTLTKENGEKVPWIDENLNPHTGDWISRTRLKTWQNNTWSAEKGGVERGKDYNHSTFCDLIISGLMGIKAQPNNRLVVDPLVPDNTWDYFCLDNLLYHGKIITVLFDKSGEQYGKGKGLKIFVNGIEKASAKTIEKLNVVMD